MAKILLPYQQRAIQQAEKHRFSVFMWSRQIGKSFAFSYFAVLRALQRHNHKVLVVSPTKRQSELFMEKVHRHVDAMREIGKKLGYTVMEDAEKQVLKTIFPNGSQIVGMPSNPEGVRGFTGDVILEEAAFFQDGYRIFEAVFPAITRSSDYKLVAISTPNTKKDVFYHIWMMAEGNPAWYREKITIHDAIQEGLEGVDIEELRKGIPSEQIWRKEYLCEFIEEEDTILPYEIIQSCEDIDIEKDIREIQGDIYIGVDIGRREDLTVISIVEKLSNMLFLRKQEVLKKISFSEQFQIIDHFCSYARLVAVDETGIGMQLAEDLRKRWGEIKIVPVYFTNRIKEEMAEKLRVKFMDRLIRIPPNRDLREDLHSVRKTVTEHGHLRYEGGTNEGHADRFWSLALAVYAASLTEPKRVAPIFFAQQRREYGYSYGLV